MCFSSGFPAQFTNVKTMKILVCLILYFHIVRNQLGVLDRQVWAIAVLGLDLTAQDGGLETDHHRIQHRTTI